MERKKNVKIVVLGDIGHSPRMANHAISLAKSGHTTDIIGYGESELPHQFKTTPNIYHHFLVPCPRIGLRMLNYIWKTIWTSINLFFVLVITRKADVVLVQNPPAIPSLVISWIYCKLIGAELIIDWHNYAYTIMALSVGHKSPLVSLTKMIEKTIGKKADHNFCVSEAMRKDLLENWSIRAQVVYDRPGSCFGSVSKSEMHDFLQVLGKKKGFGVFIDGNNENATLFSQNLPETGICLKEDRPAFIVSSTSWTEDEDFSVLVDALQDYENHRKSGNQKNLPKLLVAITGKGPLKEYYLKDIESRNWEHVTVITPWLDDEDYPHFIGCADIGISLHTSSSGLDLPMKVVDLFGANVPVLAYNFKALNELVIDGKNGYVFSSQKELSNLLQELFAGFPLNETTNRNLDKLRKELGSFEKWDAIWNDVCKPVFNDP